MTKKVNNKTRPIIPLEKNTFSRFLPWLVGFMVYLATLFMAVGYITSSAGYKWTSGITNSLSVQIVHPKKITDSARADILDRATIMLGQTEGVKFVRALSRQEIVNLLVPWLGGGLEYTNLPVPDMIEVELYDGININIEEMRDNLSQVTENLIIDDYQIWRQKVTTIVGSITTVVYTLTLLILISAIIMVIAATRGLMTMNMQTINMLVLMGATDKFISRDFCSHAFRLGLKSSIAGFICAYITIFSLWSIGGQAGSALSFMQWLLLLLVVPFTSYISLLSSFITVKATLKRRFYGEE